MTEKITLSPAAYAHVLQLVSERACPGCGCEPEITRLTIDRAGMASATPQPCLVSCACGATLRWSSDGYTLVLY